MAGHKAGKWHCGASLTHKRCASGTCRGDPRAWPTGDVCPICGRRLLPWCETWVNTGTTCEHHTEARIYPRHPDCPSDFVEILAHEAGPRAVTWLERTKDKPLHEQMAELARVMAIRAIDHGDPRSAESSARAAEGAARVAEIARKAEQDKPTKTGGMVTIRVNRKELPNRPPAPPPPDESDNE